MNMMFAYIAPETVLPMTSVFMAVVGSILMFGKGILAAVARGLRRIRTTTVRD